MDGLTLIRAQWDRVAGGILVVSGGLVIATGASQARGAVRVADQFSLLMSGGVGGLALGSLGCSLLVSAGFHDEWRKLDAVEKALEDSSFSNGEKRPPMAARNGPSTLGRWLRAEWDRTLGWSLIIVGLAILVLGGRGVTDTRYLTEQVALLASGGLGALLLILAGASSLLIADARDGCRKLARIADRLDTTARGGSALGAPRLGVVVVLVVAAGVGLICLGWAKAADAVVLRRAMDGLVIAVSGLGLAVGGLVAATLWCRHRLACRAADVCSEVQSAAVASGPTLSTLDITEAWSVPGLRRFHRDSCPALARLPGARFVVQPDDTDLEPCLICHREADGA